MTFRNVPQLEAIVVTSFVNAATSDRGALAVAGIALMQMTGVRATVVNARTTIGAWGLTKGKPVGVKVRLEGPAMYRFLASCIEVVMPKIKEFQGIRSTTGDDAGNLSFGFTPDAVAMFPEIEGLFVHGFLSSSSHSSFFRLLFFLSSPYPICSSDDRSVHEKPQ